MNFGQGQTTDALQRAAELNSQGVYRLSLNDSHGAVASFKSALSNINAYLNETLQEDVASSMSADQPWHTISIPGMEDDAFYVHNQAFVMHSETMRMPQNVATASVIILFNLALSYHWHGMRFRQKPILEKACTVYKMCANIITDNDGPKSGTDHTTAVALVAMNNEAQVRYRLLGDPDKSLELLGKLGKWYTELKGPICLDPLQLDEVLLNVTTLPCAPLRASPAA
jgi:hypothetical protein